MFRRKLVVKTRRFKRWADAVGIQDEDLLRAVREVSGGLVDADLDGGVLKKRIGVPGRGKRGGARLILATNRIDRWFYLYGFLKNQRAAISQREVRALQELARDLLELSEANIHVQTEIGAFEEVDQRSRQ